MLRYFTQAGINDIEFIDSINDDDIALLSKLIAQKSEEHFKLHLLNYYTIPEKLVDLLYSIDEMVEENIEVYVNRYRLSRYLHSLGFSSILNINYSFEIDTLQNPEILVIGGSSNSSEKIIEILSGIDAKNLAIFIVQHISPHYDTYFDTILSKYTNATISYAEDGVKVKRGHIYIAPKNRHLRVEKGVIALDDTARQNAARPSISITFNSLAKEYKSKLIALLTCGNESDGVDALAYLKEQGVTTIIQESSECKADSIPQHAKKSGYYNYILKSKDIIFYLQTQMLHLKSETHYIEYILREIKERYEYDFKEYNRDFISRRLEQFMIRNKIKSMHSLLLLISLNEYAFKALFLEFSVNVTHFYRKEQSSQKMIELLQREYKHSYNIKIWSAGCSTGEEIYSTAIILNELGLLQKTLLYATDINSVIIEEAKNGIYALEAYKSAENVYKSFQFRSPLSSYFVINNKYVKIRDSIKERVLFFVHNLEKDSVFNEFDIIECKNVMIYFDDQLKEQVFQLLYDSLKYGGHLLIGESEALSAKFLKKFQKCRDECHVYKKIA